MRREILKQKAKAFVQDEAGNFLILKRSATTKHRPQESDLVGGKVDKTDRSVLEAMYREGLEEIGIFLQNPIFLKPVFQKKETKKQVVTSETSLFSATVPGIMPELVLSDEHDSSLWLPGAELVLLDDLPERYRQVAVEMLVKDIVEEPLVNSFNAPENLVRFSRTIGQT